MRVCKVGQGLKGYMPVGEEIEMKPLVEVSLMAQILPILRKIPYSNDHFLVFTKDEEQMILQALAPIMGGIDITHSSGAHDGGEVKLLELMLQAEGGFPVFVPEDPNTDLPITEAPLVLAIQK